MSTLRIALNRVPTLIGVGESCFVGHVDYQEV